MLKKTSDEQGGAILVEAEGQVSHRELAGALKEFERLVSLRKQMKVLQSCARRRAWSLPPSERTRPSRSAT